MLIYRSDVGLWARLEAGALSSCIEVIRNRYGDGAVLQPNRLGNLLILTPLGENIDRSPSENGVGLFYCGYIDLAVGDVVWETEGINSLKNNIEPGVGYTKIDGGRTDIPVSRHERVTA